MKSVLIALSFLMTMGSAFSQGLLPAEFEVQTVRLISTAHGTGARLMIQEDNNTLTRAHFTTDDLVDFDSRFSRSLSGDDAIYCTVKVYKNNTTTWYSSSNPDVFLDSIRLCVDKDEQIVAVGNPARREALIREDLEKVIEKSHVEVEQHRIGVDRSPGKPVEDSQQQGGWYSNGASGI